MTKKFFVAICLVGGFVMSANAQIVFFADRTSFDAACPDTVFEDFEDITGLTGIDLVTGPVIDSMSSSGPVMPGDIVDGIELTVVDNDGDFIQDMIILSTAGGNPVGVPSTIYGPNAFLDSFQMNFPGGADCVGFDLYSFANNPGTLDLTFMNGEKVLGTVASGADTTAAFTGAMTSGGEVITSVVVENELDAVGGNSLGELVDDISFRLADVGCAFELGDVNEDGEVTLLDVQPFVDLLTATGFLCQADINGDGEVTLLDVDPFVVLLGG